MRDSKKQKMIGYIFSCNSEVTHQIQREKKYNQQFMIQLLEYDNLKVLGKELFGKNWHFFWSIYAKN